MPDDYRRLQQLIQKGQRGSPDLPSAEAQGALDQMPTDGMIQAFIDRFGLARAQNPGGAPEGEIPMPRPRLPMEEASVMGGTVPHGGPPLGTLRTSDVAREVYPQDEPEAQDNSDEEMLESVRKGMGNESGPPPGSGMKWMDLREDQDTLEGDPSPDNMEAFIQYWGEENVPESLGGDTSGSTGTGDVMRGGR